MSSLQEFYTSHNSNFGLEMDDYKDKVEHISKGIFMDYQATTPLESEVLDTIMVALRDCWGNPSSTYQAGVCAKEVIQNSRTWIKRMINAQFDENIIFTSGGTESNNMVLQSVIKHFRHCYPMTQSNSESKPHIITSNIEHDSIAKVLEHFEKEGLADVTYVKVSHFTGKVDVQDIVNAVKQTTCLVTVMMANNETGIVQPISEIAAAVNSINKTFKVHRILLHTDAAQTIGKIPVDVSKLGVDYLTIVGHKFYGPRIGALYVNKQDSKVPIYPLLFGGGQEKDIRPGTENTGMIAGLGKASELVCKNLEDYSSHMKMVLQYLEDMLQKHFGDGIVLNARYGDSERIPSVCNVSFIASGLSGREILERCKKLQASVGAACHSGLEEKPSQILLAFGVAPETASSAIRLSVGRHTSKSDVEAVVEDLLEATNTGTK